MHSKVRLDDGATGPNIADDDRSRNNHQMSAGVDMDDDDMMAEVLADSLFDVEDLKLRFDLSESSIPSSPVTDDMKCLTLDITAERSVANVAILLGSPYLGQLPVGCH